VQLAEVKYRKEIIQKTAQAGGISIKNAGLQLKS